MVRNKKAEMGVGTLVVFIAMLIVAAVAAGVLISTIGTLQQKALITGAETTGEISSHIFIIQVTGEDGSENYLGNLTMLVKLAAGSDPIDLGDTLLEVGLSDDARQLRYTTSSYVPLAQRDTAANFSFWVNFTITGAEHQAGGSSLVRGDVASIGMWLPRDVVTDEKIHISMIPKVGTASSIDIRTPDTISTKRVYLYP